MTLIYQPFMNSYYSETSNTYAETIFVKAEMIYQNFERNGISELLSVQNFIHNTYLIL